MDRNDMLTALLTAAPQDQDDLLPAMSWPFGDPQAPVEEPGEEDDFDALLWASLLLV